MPYDLYKNKSHAFNYSEWSYVYHTVTQDSMGGDEIWKCYQKMKHGDRANSVANTTGNIEQTYFELVLLFRRD